MPRITTKSGRTLDDVLNDECHDRDRWPIDSSPPGATTDGETVRFPSTGEITMPARTFDLRDDRTTRRGDSIVPPSLRIAFNPRALEFGGKVIRSDRGPPLSPGFLVRDGYLPGEDGVWRRPASHRADPHTSAQAAGSMSQAAQHHRVAVMTALRLFGPATGHELAALLGLEYVQVAKRLTELAAVGRINRRETGTIGGKPAYQTRNSPTGRPACVWHINPLAKSA